MIIVEAELGESGRQHLLGRVGDGLTLSRRVLQLRQAGRIWAFLPVATQEDYTRNLELSGLGERQARRTRLIGFISEYLGRAQTNCAIAEDYLARSDDPVTTIGTIPNFSLHGEIYHYLAGGGRSQSEVEALLTAGRSYRLTVVLSQLRRKPANGVSEAGLAGIARAAKTIVVDAWHNEGEILCELVDRAGGAAVDDAGRHDNAKTIRRPL